jgi:HSP20 family protein
MALVRWRPTRDLLNIQDEINRLMERFFSPTLFEEPEMMTPTAWYPNVDIKETKDEFIVTAELPGMKKDDIHISYKDGILTLEGERKKETEEKDVNYHRVERVYGKFSRTFQLPALVNQDKINATYKDGILEIHLPKVEDAKPKEIEVKVA